MDSDLSSVLYFSLVFISDFPSPSFSFFAFWTLDNSSSLKVAFSCPTCLALFAFLIKCDKTMVYTEKGQENSRGQEVESKTLHTRI